VDNVSLSASGTAGPGLRRVRPNQSTTHRLRVIPWQGNRRVALVGPGRNARPPTTADLIACVRQLDRRGVTRIVTPALERSDSQPFIDAGFSLLERLHLLSRPLEDSPPEPSRRIHAGQAWHRSRVLQIDKLAFESFWQFDATALKEARTATPTSRFRVVMERRRPIGYAVTGKAGGHGYLQRLAVHPEAQGAGIGTDLVNDSLLWLHKKGAKLVMVNTQERNQRALALYQHLGFQPEPEGLVVLERIRPS